MKIGSIFMKGYLKMGYVYYTQAVTQFYTLYFWIETVTWFFKIVTSSHDFNSKMECM